MFFWENEGAVFGSGMKALSCVYSALVGPEDTALMSLYDHMT